MLMYYAVFVLFCIFNVSTQNTQNDTYDDSGTRVNINGWNYYFKEDTENGTQDVFCSCTEDLEKDNLPVIWNSSALLNITQSVTIENCNLDVTIESEDDESMTSELKDFDYFNRLKIRNVTSLKIGPLFSGLLLKMKGELTISIEDVQNITLLPTEFLNFHSEMESLHFEMKNVKIESVDKNAIICNDTNKPITLTLDNVNVQNIESEAIFMTGYDNETIGDDEEPNYQDRKVHIINSNFKDFPSDAIKGVIYDLQFINNSVQMVENCFINIMTTNVNISNNEFNHLKNFSFSCISRVGENSTLNFDSNKINASEEVSMHFGKYNGSEESTSFFHNNMFKCLNSEWMKIKSGQELMETNYSREDGIMVNYKDIEKYENFLYESTDNVCSDAEFECIKSMKDFRHDYQVFEQKWENYCPNELNYFIFIITAIIILAIVVVISALVYCYTVGNFTPSCIDSSREYEVYLAEQQRPTYGQEELAEPIEIELKNDDEIKIKTSR